MVVKFYSSILKQQASNNSILVDEQNGFRKERSCLDNVFEWNSKLVMQNRKSKFATFIDFQKAFDLVDRQLLQYKLILNGIDANMYNAIFRLYLKTESCVRLNN